MQKNIFQIVHVLILVPVELKKHNVIRHENTHVGAHYSWLRNRHKNLTPLLPKILHLFPVLRVLTVHCYGGN